MAGDEGAVKAATRKIALSGWQQADLSDTFSVQPLDAATVHAARLTVASHAHDTDEAAELLAMLGIGDDVVVAWEVAG